MTPEQIKYLKIEAYLKGKLNSEELKDFQDALKSDQELKKEVDKHAFANELLLHNRLANANEYSKLYQAKYQKAEFLKKVILISIIGSVILGIGYLTFKSSFSKEVITKDISFTSDTMVKSESKFEQPIREHIEEISKSKKIINKPELITKAPLDNASDLTLTEHKILIEEPEKENEIKSVKEQSEQEITLPEPISPKKLTLEEPHLLKSLCSNVKLKANIKVTNTCIGQSSGKIHLKNYNGGTAPYTFEIYSSDPSINYGEEGLPKGSYNIILKDRNACSTKVENVTIKEVICVSEEEEEKAFNPFLNEVLELPSHPSKGTFVVYEKSGVIYYNKELNQGEKSEWNGISKSGKQETGHFFYEIVYQDGTRKHGNVTITR